MDQFFNVGDGRKDPVEYWKSVMKGEPMPEAIEELVHEDWSPLSEGTKKVAVLIFWVYKNGPLHKGLQYQA